MHEGRGADRAQDKCGGCISIILSNFITLVTTLYVSFATNKAFADKYKRMYFSKNGLRTELVGYPIDAGFNWLYTYSTLSTDRGTDTSQT